MHMKSPSPSVHTGNGVPQKRSRDSAQSTLLASQFPNRPSRMVSGTQLMVRFSSTIRSRIRLVSMYHACFA